MSVTGEAESEQGAEQVVDAGVPDDGGVDSIVGRMARSGVWLMLAHIATAGAAFVVSVVVARETGKADFGRYSFFFFLVTLLPTLVALGVPASISRLLPERIGAGDEPGAFALFRRAIRVHLWVLAPAVAVAVALGLANDRSRLPAVVLGGATVALLLGLDYEALLTALRRFSTLTYVAFGTAIAQVVAVLGGAVSGVGWRGFLALQTAALAAGVIPVVAIGRRRMAAEPHVEATEEHRRAFAVYGRQQAFRLLLTQVLWGRPEVLFLEASHPDAEVGLYSAALRLASIAAMLPLVSTRSLVPEFAFLRGAGADDALRRTYPRICVLLAALTAPLALGGAAIAGPLVTVFFGAEYAAATTAAQILLAGSMVNALQGPASAAALTGPRPRFTIEVGIVTAVANLSLAALLIPRYGVEAAAGVNVAAQTGAVLAGIVYARIRLGLAYPVARVAAVVVIAAVAAVAAWAATEAVDGVVGLGLAVAAAGVVYVALLLGTRTLSLTDLRSMLRAEPDVPTEVDS